MVPARGTWPPQSTIKGTPTGNGNGATSGEATATLVVLALVPPSPVLRAAKFRIQDAKL